MTQKSHKKDFVDLWIELIQEHLSGELDVVEIRPAKNKKFHYHEGDE